MTRPHLPPGQSHRALPERSIFARLLAWILVVLALPLPVFAQVGAATDSQISAPLTLHITILEGENALNNIRQRTAREPIVQVEDANHKPVAGVAVLFTSVRGPNGAGGTFNSFTSYKTVTNAEGKAVGRGFQPNTTTGQFTINVTATLGTMMAVAIVIHEQNTLAAGAGNGASTELPASASPPPNESRPFHLFHIIPKWAIVGIVVGGTAIGIAAVTHNSSGAVISSGGGTVTAPAVSTAPTRH